MSLTGLELARSVTTAGDGGLLLEPGAVQVLLVPADA